MELTSEKLAELKLKAKDIRKQLEGLTYSEALKILHLTELSLQESQSDEIIRNNNPLKYRIMKTNGVYRIQVWGYEQTGFLWMKKKEGWYSTNIWGGVCNIYPFPQPMSRGYKTLKKAKRQVKKWNEPTK